MLIAISGCNDERTVRTYTVPKEQPPPDAPAAALAPPDAPHPTMPALPAGTMRWDVPEGWREVANTNSMRFATLVAGEGEGDGAIEVAVTQLVGTGGGIAANINRWRGQLGLPSASERELASQARLVTARDGVQGIVVDLVGPSGGPDVPAPRMLAAIFPAQRNTWFIKATAPADVLERHVASFDALCESVSFDGPAAASAPPEPPPGAAAPSGPALPFTWGELPLGWTADAVPGAMSVASFTVTGAGQTASLTITPLGGDQDLLANVNRWRRQVGMAPVSELAGDATAQLDVGGAPGTLVDMAGPGGHTIAVVSQRGPMTWFYKLSGPDPLVGDHRLAFEAFIESIRFEGDAP